MRALAVSVLVAAGLAVGACPAWGQWKMRVLTGNRGADGDSAVVADSELYAHVLFNGASGNGLFHAWQDWAGWHQEQADPGVVGLCAAAIDRVDRPHAVYGDPRDNSLRHGWRDGAGWHVETIPGITAELASISLALDGSDAPHLAYIERSTWRVVHVWQEPMGWQAEVVERPEYAQGCAIAIDSHSRVHLAYLRVTDVCHAWREERERVWHFDTVLAHMNGGDASIGVDGYDRARIAYGASGATGALYCITQTPTGWGSRAVDRRGIGPHPSVAVDRGGRVCIAYHDQNADDLRYATWDTGAGWRVTTLDAEGQTGRLPSLYVGPKSYSHISYFDFTNRRLKLLTNVDHWPSRPAVTLNPDPPAAGVAIRVTAAGSVDPDGDALQYEYVWAVQAGATWTESRRLQTAATTDTLPARTTRRGQVWRCTVRVTDGAVYTDPLQCTTTVQ